MSPGREDLERGPICNATTEEVRDVPHYLRQSHKVTIDMDGLHNIVTIDRVFLARMAYKVGHGTSVKRKGEITVTTCEDSKEMHEE